jgi:hypothetical protein
VHSSLKGSTRKRVTALLGAFAFGLVAAGCHTNTQTSNYGVAWITLTDEPGDFTSYMVAVNSVVMTGKTYGAVTAIAAPELVDFTKLVNFSELWASAYLPVDTYTAATITLDYTNAQISVQVDGKPVRAKVVDPTGAAVTLVTIVVTLDPLNQLVLHQTFAGTNALRLAFDFDLAASNSVDLTTSPPTVTIKPFMTAATAASDTKLIRVRGPLVNSSVNVGTYSTFVRPFFDEVNNLGSLTIFNGPNTVASTPNTIWTLNGSTYVGAPGMLALSKTSAGSTMVAAYCTFQPTLTPRPGITAGVFLSNYVVAGSTLEDFYTVGLEGDVIARSGNTLTLRGATLFANASQIVAYQNLDSLVLLAPQTLVTADDTATLPNLNYNSISVGQHITARGLYSVDSTGIVTVDSTGSSSTNTGSVRLQSTQMFGSMVSAASGNLVLNLQAINDWPVSNYNFAGNGLTPAQDSMPANYVVNTGTLALPPGPDGVTPAAPPDLLWIDGFTSPFGTAPPDFIAESIQSAPTVPATMIVTWPAGTLAPFILPLTNSNLTVDLSNPALALLPANQRPQIRIGADYIDLTSAPSPLIVPAVAPPPPPGLPPVFLPLFGVGNPNLGILSFNDYTEYVAQLNKEATSAVPVFKFTARGYYNPTTNIFTASAIDVLL